MGKYFVLKLKSLLKVFPYIFLAVILLFACLFLVFGAVLKAAEGEGKVRFQLALVCEDNDPYFLAGLDIVQAYDSTRFSIETVQMDEAQAQKELEQGTLDAYVVIPNGYIQAAMDGKLGTLKYVSTTGAADLTTLFKDEVTGVVSDLIVTCEKAMFGVEQIAADYDFEDRAAFYTKEISLKYVDYILDRTDMYYVDELGIHDSLGSDGYMFAGITVLVFSVMLIPAGVCFIKQDMTIPLLLKSKNVGAAMQVAVEYLAFIIVLLIPIALISMFVVLMGPAMPDSLYRLLKVFSLENLVWVIVVLLNLGAFGYLLFQCANELVGGILLYFFVAIALCFISGCIYSVYFFPEVLRNVSLYTPQGISRSILSGCIVGNVNKCEIMVLSAYTVVLLGGSYAMRSLRLRVTKG